MNRRSLLMIIGLSLPLAACSPMKKREGDCGPLESGCSEEPTARTGNRPDIGAHEFGSTPDFDPLKDVGAKH
jgi:hypothetical protein